MPITDRSALFSGLVIHFFQRSLDQRDGCTELMRDVGEETGLEIIQFAQVFSAVFEFYSFDVIMSPIKKHRCERQAI